MNKRILLLSTATLALLSSAALADQTISSSTSTALKTSTDGNITVASGGSIGVSSATGGAITVDSNNFVSVLGGVSNKNNTNASGIYVDMTKSPHPTISSNTANTSSFGIDFGSTGALTVNGSGTAHYGVWLNNSTYSTTNTTAYTYTGPITFEAGSSVSITGDSSDAVHIDQGSILAGNLTFAGTVSVAPSSTSSTSVGTAGLVSLGQITGNVSLVSGGTINVTGGGGMGMLISGTGVTQTSSTSHDGSITIGGAISISGVSAQTTVNPYQSPKVTGNPDGGPGLAVAASVDGGIAIQGPTASTSTTAAGSITVYGSTGAFVISPAYNTTVSAPAINIGVYSDSANPGFSVLNRGTISITPENIDEGSTGIVIAGASSANPTSLAGGFYNSGSITAGGVTQSNQSSGVSVVGVRIDNYAYLDGVSGSYNWNTDPSVHSGATGTSDATLAGKNAATANDPGDQAAFVNSGITGSGTISATTSGTRGGATMAVFINAAARVPSLINTGTIQAITATSDATIAGNTSGSNNPLMATAIYDGSGSLTYIYNGGTISACAGVASSASCSGMSALNNNSQIARAIDLSAGTPGSASGKGVTIVSASSLTKSATIVGDVLFGGGDAQVLTLQGNGANHPSSLTGNVTYGLGSGAGATNDQLNIGSFSVLTGIVTTQDTTLGSGVAVDVASHGILNLLNTTNALNATDFHIASGGNVNLGVSEKLTSSGVVSAQSVSMDNGAILGVSYSSFVPQGTTDFVLATSSKGGMNIDAQTLATANDALLTDVSSGGALPYLFDNAQLAVDTSSSTSVDKLVLHVVTKTTTQLGLTGYAAQMFPYANTALGVDDALGSAMVNGIHNAAQAQRAYDSFAPDVSGGTRAIAISITDQATGVVAARQRALRLYGKETGGMTLWGNEFVQMMKYPGQGATQADGSRAKSGFKDHGFGFSLGIDGGSPKYGWYGVAGTFYAGDVNEIERTAHSVEQWYLLTGYSAWRGKGLFFDSKIDVGYGHINGKRFINLTIPATSGTVATYTREADTKHGAELLSGGFSTGAMFSYGAATLMPQISVDGLVLREEGYTETNPGTATVGDGFNLRVQPYYAKSLRVFLGADVRYDIDLWDFYLQPEARAGYRYDLFNDPVKLKAAFAHADVSGLVPAAGQQFTLQGPDPAQGNFVLGGSLSTTTDTWTMGLHFDYVRGSNGAMEEVGTFSLLGRI